jgi:methyl-accepting chemotaxis protein
MGKQALFYLVFAATVLFAALVVLTQRRLIRQLKAIRKDLRQFSAEGAIDLSEPFKSPEAGPAVDLISSLNTMTGSLNSIFLDITRSTRKFNLFASDIFFSARHLSEQSDSQFRTMEGIMERVAGFEESLLSLEDRISTILENLSETSLAYENLQTKSRDASVTLGPLADSTRKASEDSRQGQEKIDLSSRSVTELVEGLTRLQTGMDQMNQRNSRIGHVIKTLEDIADRTHVLATNASIEAARAGQEGRGFGVIASEIRTLAANSRSAIHDVGEFLKETRREVSESSRLWAEEMARVDQVRTFGEETRQVLDEISGQLAQVSRAMGGFQQLFDQQHGVILGTLNRSREIHRGIEGFNSELQAQSRGYREIQADVGRAAEQSRTSSRSAGCCRSWEPISGSADRS